MVRIYILHYWVILMFWFLNPNISFCKIDFYRVEKIDMGNIPLTHLCQWNMLIQLSQVHTVAFIVRV